MVTIEDSLIKIYGITLLKIIRGSCRQMKIFDSLALSTSD